jgi:hypothetical protein
MNAGDVFILGSPAWGGDWYPRVTAREREREVPRLGERDTEVRKIELV